MRLMVTAGNKIYYYGARAGTGRRLEQLRTADSAARQREHRSCLDPGRIRPIRGGTTLCGVGMLAPARQLERVRHTL
jgi:hypothetical protein